MPINKSMKRIFLIALLLSACQKPHFNTQASHSSDTANERCPVSLAAVKNCIRKELFDFLDDYHRNKDKKRVRTELATDLLGKHLFQYCGEDSGLLEKLKDLEVSEESQCQNAALMESLLTFLDQLTLDVTLRIIRNNSSR